jgi:ABC-type polysaccharide/polyol phosphate export permease
VFKTVVLLPSSLPWACFFVALINFSFSIIVLVSIYFYFDFSIGLSFLSVFIAFLICFAAGLSFGLPLASFSNIYQDFSNSVGFLGSVLLWFTPVFYQTSNDGTLGLINFYNPINYLISAPRAILLNESYPHWVIYSTCICVFGMNHLIGFWFYKNTVRKTLEYVV